ncbi:MAG: HD domain-containing protein [Magnetococcales bacterium]|nr:HD domain-containing protein [Magnetococcales bacterium]
MRETTDRQEYDIHDPALLSNMMLSVSVKHPETGVVLITRKTPLTPKILKQLVSRGITTIQAKPLAGEMLNAAVEDVKQVFSLVEGIITDKGQSIQSAAAIFQEMGQVKTLRDMVKNRMGAIFHLFNQRAADAMIELNNHHPDTAHHSVITGFNVMAIAKELGWGEERTLQAVMAAMQHDIGKIKVRLDTLEWPGRLDKTKWGEIQLHSLFGAKLLYEGKLDLPVMVALTHHEWYSAVPGKGYGGFSQFRSYLQKGMGIDIPAYLQQATDDDRQAMQISAMADMISALEEIRSYKGALPPFKVLVIMNSDARIGHFNPDHYRAWHSLYLRKHATLLPAGLRVALPREKEKKQFEKGTPKKLSRPLEILTYAEMARLSIIPRLISRGLDVDRIRRRGGLLLERLRRVEGETGSLGRLITPEALKKKQIDPVKMVCPRERQLITLEAFTRRLSYRDLVQLDMLFVLEQKRFDLQLIKQADGIRISRLEKRGISVKPEKLKKQGINPINPFEVKLPGYEDRLDLNDLIKLGYTTEQLKRMRLLPLVEKSRNGAAITLLRAKGLQVTSRDLALAQIDPEKRIFYDILVTRPINQVRAEFVLVREGDTLDELEKGYKANTLDAIQNYLYASIGTIELDFSDLLEIPSQLSDIQIGDHWLS